VEWELHTPWLFRHFDDVQFYDYTKRWARVGQTPSNYALAASWSERNTMDDALWVYTQNMPTAIVFDTKATQELPTMWYGIPVVDADKSDRWMVEHQGACVIGGLRAKGKLRNQDTKFVVPA
jgi:hypothetical protein